MSPYFSPLNVGVSLLFPAFFKYIVGTKLNKLYFKRAFVVTVIFSLMLILFINTQPLRKIFLSSLHHIFLSPNETYRIELFSYNNIFPVMPGSSAGDEPGYIRLYNKDNKLLNEKEIEMLQLVETVDWSDDQVSIKLIADWELH